MEVVVTGANRGIGLEFVRQLSERGDSVLATARRPGEADELGALAEEDARDIDIAQLDIADAHSVAAFEARLAERRLDVLINNAGTYGKSGGLGSLDYESIERTFDINAMGALRTVEASLEALRRSEGAKIINLTSKMGSIDDNGSGGSYAYRMSKAALNMATRSLAIDLEPEGIVALVVHPGWVQTRMGGQNALITPEQSVTHMLELIDEAGPEHSGKFWEWDGGEISW
jgi:NAD(P)-dependent dehydrogenase (short-subunit alcohol dehydrogenase family)